MRLTREREAEIRAHIKQKAAYEVAKELLEELDAIRAEISQLNYGLEIALKERNSLLEENEKLQTIAKG